MTTGEQRAEVRAESMRLLLRQVPIALLANLANATLVALVLTSVQPSPYLAWWWAASLALVSGRLFAWWRTFRRQPPSLPSLESWERQAFIGAALSGTLWGAGAFVLFPEQAFYQIFLAFVVGGMAAGAAVSLAYSLRTYFGFVLPSVLLLAARFVLEGSPAHLAMAGMVLVYALALTLFARNQHAVLTRALALQIEKSRLAGELRELLQNVEQRVQERTEELHAANRRLSREITERERAEKAERRARGMAERANAAKSVFLAAASHDLRQPFQSLRLHLELLNRMLQADKERALAARMATTLDSTRELLDTLMDLSALETGRVKPALQRFQLKQLLGNIAGESAVLAERKGLRLRLHPCREETFVLTDPVLLTRMVRNLVSNAVRHTQKGEILVACRPRSDHVRVEVWDTGPGIDEARAQQIFEAFYSRDADEQGLGLGLWIVARTARLLDHEVEVKSRIAKGSVFSIRMARVAHQPPAKEAVDPEAASARDRDAASRPR